MRGAIPTRNVMQYVGEPTHDNLRKQVMPASSGTGWRTAPTRCLPASPSADRFPSPTVDGQRCTYRTTPFRGLPGNINQYTASLRKLTHLLREPSWVPTMIFTCASRILRATSSLRANRSAIRGCVCPPARVIDKKDSTFASSVAASTSALGEVHEPVRTTRGLIRSPPGPHTPPVTRRSTISSTAALEGAHTRIRHRLCSAGVARAPVSDGACGGGGARAGAGATCGGLEGAGTGGLTGIDTAFGGTAGGGCGTLGGQHGFNGSIPPIPNSFPASTGAATAGFLRCFGISVTKVRETKISTCNRFSDRRKHQE